MHREYCDVVSVHIVMVASSSPWARRSTRRGEAASGKERIHQGRAEKGKERKMFLCLSLVSRRGCWGREKERDAAETKDEEDDFLLTRGFSPLCSGALRYPARTVHFSHTFFRIYLPIGCIHQSTNRECGRRGFDTATCGRFRYFFSLSGETDVDRIPGLMMQQIVSSFG